MGASAPSQEELVASLLEARAALSDMKAITRLLNASGPFRYTSILRVEATDQLTSVWTYDRENPELNSFPEGKPVAASYCSRVRETNAPFVLPDAASEPSVANHPARRSFLSYCGVPLHRADGSFYGTLCSFDAEPRFVHDKVLLRLKDASAVLQKHWRELTSAES